ncbi:YqhG family protein [Sporosarcina siberiensis]|uniref:YqhG family protein n=1 Tax=Sporosarcina siberiensis TaxID=1365606 RepID=A0ABW4SEU0_9BACL
MYPQQIHNYLLQFFKENKCPILSNNDYYVIVQLTIEMDKKIMNRPFYWKYQESIGSEPNPAQITFITNKNKLEEAITGEVIHFGSPRLAQLFQVTKELGSFVQMFEEVPDEFGDKTILTPWLGINYKVSYYSDQTKETLYSLGLNLINGELVNNFQETIRTLKLDKDVSNNTFNLPYVIKPIRALERLDSTVEKIIQEDDHSWAEEAKIRRQKDEKTLEYFYAEVENKPECYEIEKEAMKQQYESRIKIEIINGGLFYLKNVKEFLSKNKNEGVLESMYR